MQLKPLFIGEIRVEEGQKSVKPCFQTAIDSAHVLLQKVETKKPGKLDQKVEINKPEVKDTISTEKTLISKKPVVKKDPKEDIFYKLKQITKEDKRKLRSKK